MSDDKYWNDYSFFIKRTEELTKYAPSSLLELYEDFVKELEEGVGASFEELINEKGSGAPASAFQTAG